MFEQNARPQLKEHRRSRRQVGCLPMLRSLPRLWRASALHHPPVMKMLSLVSTSIGTTAASTITITTTNKSLLNQDLSRNCQSIRATGVNTGAAAQSPLLQLKLQCPKCKPPTPTLASLIGTSRARGLVARMHLAARPLTQAQQHWTRTSRYLMAAAENAT